MTTTAPHRTLPRPARGRRADRAPRHRRGVPVFAVALQRSTGLHVVPRSAPSLQGIGHTLTRRDNGQLVAVILAAGVWICWALFTISLVPEVVALLAPETRAPAARPRRFPTVGRSTRRSGRHRIHHRPCSWAGSLPPATHTPRHRR